MGNKKAKRKAQKKAPSARSKKLDQLYVAKAEMTNDGRKLLKVILADAAKAEAAVPKDFEALISKNFGPKFVTRLRNSSKRRQMTPRQYAGAILVKPVGTK